MKNKPMRFLSILIICLLFPHFLIAQITVEGYVKDADNSMALPYCNILIKGTLKGTITNRDGYFSIEVQHSDNILEFSFIGYQSKSLSVFDLQKNSVVLLQSSAEGLSAFVVHPDDNYLFDILGKSRKRMQKNSSRSDTKVYFALETRAKLQSVRIPVDSVWTEILEDSSSFKPIEFLECFYNAGLNGEDVSLLKFKNGRTALAPMENYFVSLNSSKAISKLSITESSYLLPGNPHQYNKRTMKKLFSLKQVFLDSNYIIIDFEPLDNNGQLFTGRFWITKESLLVAKIEFQVDNAAKHPFQPMFSVDKIRNVSLEYSASFNNIDGEIYPAHINFDYRFNYASHRDTSTTINPEQHKIVERSIESRSLLYFYDYGKPFILPFFDYDSRFGDYRKMSVIPYNPEFWTNNITLKLTDEQQQNFGMISQTGELINYGEGNYGKDFLNLPNSVSNRMFEFYYPFWSEQKRLVPVAYSKRYEEYSTEKLSKSSIESIVNLEVQILLDITESGDSLLFRSYTVFDEAKSYYHYKIDWLQKAWFNIYFDMCEIERRKLQKQIKTGSYTLNDITILYEEMQKELYQLTQQFMKETGYGNDEIGIKKWNDYVNANLGIDNILLVENSKKAIEARE